MLSQVTDDLYFSVIVIGPARAPIHMFILLEFEDTKQVYFSGEPSTLVLNCTWFIY
jgi:hypothetical protein